MNAKSVIGRVLTLVLLAFSVWNSIDALRRNFHWPLAADDEWTRLHHDLSHAREVLSKLPDRHIEYRIEEASTTYDSAAYYRLQYLLAPAILQHEPVADRYVLVEFWSTRTARPVPDLKFIDDLGHGFGLYERP
jgi:hypothetical protein